MSAIASNHSVMFPLREAARIIGMHPGNLAKQICGPELIKAGIVKREREGGRGQEKLFVSPAFHPKLRIAVNSYLHTPSDLSAYNAEQQNEAHLRALACDRVRKAMEDLPAAVRMAHIKTQVVLRMRGECSELAISMKTLDRWLRVYAFPCDLEKLVDRRGGDRRSQGHPEVWKFAISIKLSPTDPPLLEVWNAANQFASDNNLDWCSQDSFKRQIKKRIPAATLDRHTHPKTYRNCIAPFIEQDPERYAAGECWHADTKTCDVICSDGGKLLRPVLVAWFDWRSRKTVAARLFTSDDSHAARSTLARAIRDKSNFGGPDRMHLDHGKNYESYELVGATKKQRRVKIKDHAAPINDAGLYSLIGIEASFAQRYNPQGKARLERWFRTLEPFFKLFPTYTGRDVDTKPESLPENLKSAPTLASVQERLDAFVATYNASSDHQIDDLVVDGVRYSPNDFYARFCPRVKVMADPNSLDKICRRWLPPCWVGRNGISVKMDGRTIRFGQYETSLIEFKGRLKRDRTQVRVSIDPDKPSVAYVHRMNYKFVCRVEANHAAFDREGLKRSMREKRQYDKAVRIKREYEYTDLLTPEQHARDASIRNRQEQQQRDDPPRPMRIQTTPLDGQAKHLDRQQLRKAVGAESVNTDRPSGPSMLESLRRNIAPRERCEQIGGATRWIFYRSFPMGTEHDMPDDGTVYSDLRRGKTPGIRHRGIRHWMA